MFISFGLIGFQPLQSKMIRVHAPALCMKKKDLKFIDNEGGLPVFTGTYENIFFTVIFRREV